MHITKYTRDFLKNAFLGLCVYFMYSTCVLANEWAPLATYRPVVAPVFFAQGFRYEFKDGVLEQTCKITAKKNRVRLFSNGSDLDALFIYQKGDSLILFLETASMDNMLGVFCLREQDLKIIWKKGLQTFNLGEPLFRGDAIYLTSIGAAYKINLKTGVIIWEVTGLYKNGRFNAFRKPVIKNTLVVFKEEKGESILEVNSDTGQYRIR